jgi:hypothetical protein
MDWMAMASLPWQPRCVLVNQQKTAKYSQEMCFVLRVNCPLFSSSFNQNLTMSTDFSKTP